MISYAVNCPILASNQDVDDLCTKVNCFLDHLSPLLHCKIISNLIRKTSVTFSTNWTKVYRFELVAKVDGVKILTIKMRKLLGYTFDSLHSFSLHMTEIATKLQSYYKIPKALAGRTWGKERETLLATMLLRSGCRGLARRY